MNNQQTILIFDFMRTLYDPERGQLFVGVHELLSTLADRGYQLVLVSRKEGQRQEDIKSLGITDYFEAIYFTEDKRTVIKAIKEKDPHCPIWVIGDRALEEIKHGIEFGTKTIWIRKGKFKDEHNDRHTQPNYIIDDITKIAEIVS